MDLPFEEPAGISLELDVSPASWIDESVLPFRGSGEGVLVGEIVPTGFDAYARLLHPARRRTGDRYEPASWAELARERRERIHPEVQLNAILGEELRDAQTHAEPFETTFSSWGRSTRSRGSRSETSRHSPRTTGGRTTGRGS